MTSVATISASTAAEAAAFTGPARSTDSSGQFATELNKTTQQVRERHDGQQPAHSNRSVDRQVDRAVENNAVNAEPTSADSDPRIQTSKSEIDQPVTDNQVGELAESETNDSEINEDLGANAIGLAVTVPVVAEPVITNPTNSDVGDLGVIDPTDVDLPVEASARSQEGLAAAALAASTISGITPTSSNPGDNPTAAIEVPANVAAVAMSSGQLSSGQASLSTSLSATNNAQSAELATENMAQTGNVETGNLDTGSIENRISVTGTGEAVNNARGTSSANSLAADSADAESGVNNNMGTMPVPNTMNINSPTDDGAVAQSPDIASQPAGSPLQDSQPEVTTKAPDVADGEGAEVPSGSNPALSSLTNSASTDTESESGSTTPTNSGSSAGSSHEQPMGTDPSVQSEGITVDRGQGPETRASLDAPISPIVANSASASAATSVTLGAGSALPTAEPKAPAPVSTQMSAHLTTFKGLADGTYETTLRLYPEELGQVSVRIQVNGGTVSIHAFGASDMAVQALREAMPDLRQDLLRSGLDLVDSQVDQGSAFLGNERESSSGRMVDSENPDRPVSQRNGEVSGADMETLTSIDPSRGGRVDVRV